MRFLLSLAGAAFLAANTFAQTADQESDFLARVNQAYQAKDAKAYLALYCWDGVDKFMRDQTEDMTGDEITNVLDKAEIVPVGKDDVMGDFTVNGVTYTMNLMPVKTLKLTYKGSADGQDGASVPLGLKDGKLMIVAAAPKAGGKAAVSATDGWSDVQKLTISCNHTTYAAPALEMIARQYLKDNNITVDNGEPILNLYVGDPNKFAEVEFHKAPNLIQVVVIGPNAEATKTYESPLPLGE